MKARIEKLDNTGTENKINDTEEMKVKRMLDFDGFTAAVNNIVRGCFNEDIGEVSYEAIDFIERSEVIERYTDYPLSDDINEAFFTVYDTDVYEKARQNIDEGQLLRLFACAEAKLEAKEKQANAAVTAGVQDIIARFNKLSEQMEEIFGSVTAEQISGVFNALVDGRLDEDKIVDAVMKRQTKKDEE